MILMPSEPTTAECDLPQGSDHSTFHPFIKGVFSQWHPTHFVVDDRSFTCAEQFMMAAKATLFEDATAFERIMATDDPALQKRLGAGVLAFD